MMAGKRKYSSDAIAQALRESQGAVSIAARRLGCDKDTIFYRMRKEPELRRVRDDARELMLDRAELTLVSQALGDPVTGREPHMGALIFLLKTQGYKRGYRTRLELGVDEENLLRVVNLLKRAGRNPDEVLVELARVIEDEEQIPQLTEGEFTL